MNGADGFFPKMGDPPKNGHTRIAVYTTMFFQVMRDYSIPDYRALESFEIRFFYNGIRAELKEATKPQRK